MLALLLVLLHRTALADSIPYANVGTIAPQVSLYATGNGLTAFYLGSTAAYEDQIEVYDVQTGYNSGKILDNKLNAPGAQVTIGTGAGQIRAGDQLILYIDSPAGRFSSVAANSADGINHAYITPFAGGSWNYTQIPAGLFVGMEDLARSNSDLNYNDDDFVLTGARSVTGVTAEPTSFVFLATGLLGVAVFRLRRSES